MRRTLIPLIAAALIAAPVYSERTAIAASDNPQATAAITSRLASVKTIFVAPLGSGEGSELIRQKVVNRLIKSGVVSITESPEDADAILTGASEVSHRHYITGNFSYGSGFISGGTKYSADCAVRLVSKNKRVLWTEDTSSRRFFPPHTAGGASTNVAEKMVTALVNAINADRSQMAATASAPN